MTKLYNLHLETSVCTWIDNAKKCKVQKFKCQIRPNFCRLGRLITSSRFFFCGASFDLVLNILAKCVCVDSSYRCL